MSAREILFRGKRIDNGEWVEGDDMEKLKACPFCGNKPRLEHTTRISNEREGIAEISVYWKVKCGYCGCFKDGGYSDYFVNDDGQLKICSKGYEKEPKDARLTAINEWNSRVGGTAE